MHCHTAHVPGNPTAPEHARKSLLLPLAALGAAGAVFGLLYFAAGVPSSTLLLVGAVLLMSLMHLGGHGRGQGH